ncbi:hypothetical protein MASR2M78_03710 [Treponema sp.]
MVVDVHNHLGLWSFPSQDVDSSWLLDRMKALGIDRSVISSSKALYYDFHEGNEDIAGILSPSKGLIRLRCYQPQLREGLYTGD